MKQWHKVTVYLECYASEPREEEEILELVNNYLVNDLTHKYLLTEDEKVEVSFEQILVD